VPVVSINIDIKQYITRTYKIHTNITDRSATFFALTVSHPSDKTSINLVDEALYKAKDMYFTTGTIVSF
jgi:hypothetical protein